MIFDKIDNLKKCFDDKDFEKISIFLNEISVDMDEGKYEIDGDRIYARVMSYDTLEPSECKIEAHNKYVDIQSSIDGAEGIGIFNRTCLKSVNGYDDTKDVEIYFRENSDCIATISNIPGYFTLLLPEDAHSPKQITFGKKRVKKFVIKVRTDVIKQ